MARAAGTVGSLAGIPIALKDVIGVAGMPLTADSAVLEGNVPSADATVWKRLHAAGMVLLGHLHCGEFAYGHWGANPWGRSFSPGGSSSGSGIALAARMLPATLGNDARGSVRMPAAFNSVTAVKPTFGLVSTAGCIPLTFSYDTVGPMARSAADCAALLSAMAGADPLDRPTLLQPRAPTYPLQPRSGRHPLKNLRIGVPAFGDHLSPGVSEAFDRFQSDLGRLGAVCVRFDWPTNPLEGTEAGAPGDWMHVLSAEAAVVHQQFADRKELYRDELRDFLASLPTSVSAVDYVRAQLKRSDLIGTWTALFGDLQIDAVVHPACKDELYRAGGEISADLMRRLIFGMWNDTNFPVVSVPAGLSSTDGSPVGMQLAGLPYTEPKLLQVAIDLQAATDYHLTSPPGLDDAPAYIGPQRHTVGPQPPFVAVANPFDALLPVGAP
jgi:aspartyl-tRNA(Asn)/glutamyl-tRNA(Gln) amidotransferase subunit A